MIVDDRMSTYIDSLNQEFPAYLQELEKEALADEVPIIRKSVQNFLRFHLNRQKPAKILEVGAAVGFSALLMRECCHGEIVTIEKVPQRIAEAKKNFEKYDTDKRITLLESDAYEALKKLTKEKQQFDFIFMDAAKGQYLSWLPYLLELLNDDGILVSDNVLQDGEIVQSRYAVVRRDRTIHGRMREYLYTLTHTEGIKTLVLPVGDGLTVTYIENRKNIPVFKD